MTQRSRFQQWSRLQWRCQLQQWYRLQEWCRLLPGIGSGSGSFVQKEIPIPESEISGIITALVRCEHAWVPLNPWLTGGYWEQPLSETKNVFTLHSLNVMHKITWPSVIF